MSMEVDHFNPELPTRERNQYKNLFPATRHCNNSKRNWWPTKAQIANDIRFLNCCEDIDYGEHIFEDDATHYLHGASPAGRYHIRMCDLNAPHFVKERRDRAELRKIITSRKALIRNLEKAMELKNLLTVMVDIINRMIPPIPTLAEQSDS